LAMGGHLFQVVAGGEDGAVGGEHDRAGILVAGRLFESRLERRHQRLAERVAGVGTVQDDAERRLAAEHLDERFGGQGSVHAPNVGGSPRVTNIAAKIRYYNTV